VAYLAEGADRREQIAYVSEGRRPALIEALADLPGRDAMLASGQLRVLPVSPADPSVGGGLDPGDPLSGFPGIAAAARAGGWRGMRVAVDASELADTDDQWRRFAVRHLLGDAMVAARPWSALCGYDGTRVPASLVPVLRFVHPLRREDEDTPDCALYADGDGRWRLSGDVDVTHREALSVALDALAGAHAGVAGAHDVHVDMGALEMLDVGGLREIVTLPGRLGPGRRVVLHDPPASIAEMLDMAWGDVPGLVVSRS
jgi:hypothetical protein